jgi:hypothetical protein
LSVVKSYVRAGFWTLVPERDQVVLLVVDDVVDLRRVDAPEMQRARLAIREQDEEVVAVDVRPFEECLERLVARQRLHVGGVVHELV